MLLAVAAVVLAGAGSAMACSRTPRIRRTHWRRWSGWSSPGCRPGSSNADPAAVQLATEPGPQPYAEATRLLTQLRTVARQLPGATLDPGGIAEHLIEEVRAVTPDRPGGGALRQRRRAARRARPVGGGSGRLGDLAGRRLGDRRGLGEPAGRRSRPGPSPAPAPPAPTSPAWSLPLVAGVRTVGLIALETDKVGAFPPHVVARITDLADAGRAAAGGGAALRRRPVAGHQRGAPAAGPGDPRRRRPGAGHGRLRHRQRAGHAARTGPRRPARSCAFCGPR